MANEISDELRQAVMGKIPISGATKKKAVPEHEGSYTPPEGLDISDPRHEALLEEEQLVHNNRTEMRIFEDQTEKPVDKDPNYKSHTFTLDELGKVLTNQTEILNEEVSGPKDVARNLCNKKIESNLLGGLMEGLLQ